MEKYTVDVSVGHVVLDECEGRGRGQFFVLLASSRHLCNGWMMDGIKALDCDTAYAVAVKREARMSRGGCSVACSVNTDVWKAWLYRCRQCLCASCFNLCVMGRHEGKMWRYESVGGKTKDCSKAVYNNRGGCNDWGFLDGNDLFETLLFDNLQGDELTEKRIVFFCKVGGVTARWDSSA